MTEKQRCPHDGGTCHHTCGAEPCFREEGHMNLTTPHEGYPLEGHIHPAADDDSPEFVARVKSAFREAIEDAEELIREMDAESEMDAKMAALKNLETEKVRLDPEQLNALRLSLWDAWELRCASEHGVPYEDGTPPSPGTIDSIRARLRDLEEANREKAEEKDLWHLVPRVQSLMIALLLYMEFFQ